ncbi:SGNH/GDSL hydrolase family protein [Isoptericola hypogeus]|uniref:SGNH/GDSL hydrolase family protein n=1 Tax=Isoptericola hypogeus TaxID=300179 RepID=A0ABN2JXM5_9MICO
MHEISHDTVAAAVRGAGAIEHADGRVLVRRLPDWTKAQYPDVTIETGASFLSGVRLELDTAASLIELRLLFRRLHLESAGFPLRPCVVSVEGDGELLHFVRDEGDVLRVDADWTAHHVPGATSVIRARLPRGGRSRRVVVWLPHNCAAEVVSLSADAPVDASAHRAPRWVHYGSSISNASEADDPTGVWPVIVARRLGLDLYNVALPGNAQLDGFAARTIRDTPASVITLKLGINVVNAASMLHRTFVPAVHAFLDTVREGHPHTPIVVISPIFCGPHESAPGPTEFRDGKATTRASADATAGGALTLQGIRQALVEIVDRRSRTDPYLTYRDGLTLLGPDDAARLPDDLHPDAEGYGLIARNFVDELAGILPGDAVLDDLPS